MLGDNPARPDLMNPEVETRRPRRGTSAWVWIVGVIAIVLVIGLFRNGSSTRAERHVITYSQFTRYVSEGKIVGISDGHAGKGRRVKVTGDPTSERSLARTIAPDDERHPGTGRPVPGHGLVPNVPGRDTWQFGERRTGPWVRLRDRTSARAASRALGEVTLAELLGADGYERTGDEGPWVSA